MDRIIYTDNINKSFYYVRYWEFKVLTMASTNYVNASLLCKSKNVEIIEWLNSKHTAVIIRTIERGVDGCGYLGKQKLNAVIYVKKGVYDHITGYYIHPDLLPHLCAWLSPVFAVHCSTVINCALLGEHEDVKLLKSKYKTKQKILKTQYNTLLTDFIETKEKNEYLNIKLKNLEAAVKVNKKLIEKMAHYETTHRELHVRLQELEHQNKNLIERLNNEFIV